LPVKKRRFGASGQSKQPTAVPGRIPDMVEWFSGLSVEDRVLSLTTVDEFFTNSVQTMQRKINKYGPGQFLLQQRVVSDDKKAECFLKQ
jgi:hypothetical protein